MKISDLLGEGWESEERSAAGRRTRRRPAPPWDPPATPSPGPATELVEPLEPVPAPGPRCIRRDPLADVVDRRGRGVDPQPPNRPVSARAQLADLVAGLVAPPPPPAPGPVEPEVAEEPDDLVGLVLVVDDLLPDGYEALEGLVAVVFS